MRKLLIFCIIALLATGQALVFPAEEEVDVFELREGVWKEIIAKGKFYLQTGLYDRAIGYFDSVVMNYPSAPSAYYYLGLAYYGEDDLANAEDNLKKALEINPNYAEVYYHLALVEHKKGNKDKVIAYLNEVTSLDNTFKKAYYNKGITYLALDMPERAAKEFAHALHLNPGDFPSFVGFLEAYAKMDMIEIDASDAQGFDKLRFTVLNAPSPAPPAMENPNVPVIEVKEVKDKKRDAPVKNEEENKVKDIRNVQLKYEKGIKVFLATPSGKREIDLARENPIELRSSRRAKGALEINFLKPMDLHNRHITLQIKGDRANEVVGVVLRDGSTKRSPTFRLNGISAEWKDFSIDVQSNAYNLDLDRVEHIRFELLPPEWQKRDAESVILIREIEIG